MKGNLFAVFIFVVLLQSCSADCKEETIQKPIWKTRYEEYWVKKDTVKEKTVTIDTLVSYKVSKYQTKKNYYKNSHDEIYATTVTHYVTIQNDNDKYSNSFAIRMTGKEYNESSKKWVDFDRKTEYSTIYPNSSYTFSLSHSDWWRNDQSSLSEGNVQIYILQRPSTISVTKQIISKYDKKCIRRIDELTFTDTIVNNCECDVDALKAEYKAIQKTYEKLLNERLIKE